MPIQTAADPVLGEKKQVSPSSVIASKLITTPVKLPIDANATRVYVSREGWPDPKDVDGKSLDVVEIKKWISFDGGMTWDFGGASTHVGGEWRHRAGHIMTESTLTAWDIPGEKNPNRLIKVEITPLNGNLTAAVSIQAAQIMKPAK